MRFARKFTPSERRNITILSFALFIVTFVTLNLYMGAVGKIFHALNVAGMPLHIMLKYPDNPYTQQFLDGLQKFTFILLTSLIAMLLPLSIMYKMEDRWNDGVNERLASLLRDLADSVSAGISISHALIMTAKGQGYDVLNKPLQKLAVRVSWGVPFTEAIKDFARDLGTTLSKRLEGIIIEAYRCGGNVEEIFSTAAEHISRLWELKKTRLAEVRPFALTIYIAFVVFLIITLIFSKILFPILGELGAYVTLGFGEGAGFVTSAVLTEAEVRFANIILFHAVILEGLVGGLVIGKTLRGRVASGCLHSLIMLVAGVIFYILMFIVTIRIMW